MTNHLIKLILFLLLLLTTSCTAETSESEPASEPRETPTTFPFFESGEGLINTTGLEEDTAAVATVASLFSPFKTPMPRPTLTPWATLEPFRPTRKQTNVFLESIFDDALSSAWEILDSPGTVIDTESEQRVYEGETSIAFTPEDDYRVLYFTVKDSMVSGYPANEVLGVSFMINGGDDFIHLDQLSVAVIGSNYYPYWAADDESVEFPAGESFSETRLYFLNFNDSIPPETWAEVYVPLDTLIFDPYYANVVGFYLKNDEGFHNTVYVDAVNLVMAGRPEERVLATREIPASSEATPNGEVVPEDEADETPTPTVTATAESVECVISPPPEWERHSIQLGETISGLAVEGGTSIDFTLSVNCIDADDVVSVGQVIWLPALPDSRAFPPPGE